MEEAMLRVASVTLEQPDSAAQAAMIRPLQRALQWALVPYGRMANMASGSAMIGSL